jgi:hypothetical protein
MNEVEKMYENANVEREFAYLECHRGRSSICCPIEEYEKDDECMGCINSSAMKKVYEYPPFTAEKQIELIKFLLNQGVYYSTFPNDTYQFHISDDIENPQPRKFDIAIAEIINDLWQSLTSEEKQQVKGILA